jgi:hypothetical protein
VGDALQPGTAAVAERPGVLVVMAAAPGKVIRREARTRFARAVLAGLERTTGDWSTFGSEVRRSIFEESRGEQVPYVRGTIRPGVQLAALPQAGDTSAVQPGVAPNVPTAVPVPVVPPRLAVPQPGLPQPQIVPAAPRQQLAPPRQQAAPAPPPPRVRERAPERAPPARVVRERPAERSAPSRNAGGYSGGGGGGGRSISLPGAF